MELQSIPFWNDLTEKEQQLVKNSVITKSYKKGNIIHSSEEDCLGMILVISGEVRVYLLSDEGRDVTLFRLYKDDACVLSASCVMKELTFDTQMVAEADTELLIISSSVFQRLTDSNVNVRCFMYELATKRFSSVLWVMQQILFFGFDKRLSTFLLTEYERTNNSCITMTHEQIAKDIGSAREVVARMLKRFSTDGLVELKRGSVIIKDLDGLKEI